MKSERVVWHLCSNRWNSAITEYALRSAEALALTGWRSELSALPGSPCEKRALELKVAGPSYRFKLGNIGALRQRAKAMRPDVIIVYGGPETFLARFLGVPVVRFRGQDRDLSQTFSSLNVRINMGFCRGILTPARVVRDRFKALLPRKAIESVTLGLDVGVFYPRPRKTSANPRLLIVGRLDPIKGHEMFLKLFKRLIEEWNRTIPAPFLEIIGQSSNVSAADLRLAANALGLKEGIHWGLVAERVPNLPERMANATVGVIPSLGSEVICRVAEEFLLSGTPLLVADVGSLKETLVDESFGTVLTVNDSNLESMQRLIHEAFQETPQERAARGLAASRYFSLQTMGRELDAFLRMLIKA